MSPRLIPLAFCGPATCHPRCRSSGGGLGFRCPRVACSSRAGALQRDFPFLRVLQLARQGPFFSLTSNSLGRHVLMTFATEFFAVMANPPSGLHPDLGADFKLRIDTGDCSIPWSSPIKSLSRGELKDYRQQITLCLTMAGWYRRVPLTLHLSSSHERLTRLGGFAGIFAG